MLKLFIFVIVVLLVIVLVVQVVLLGMVQVEQILCKVGYIQIYEIECDDGLWEVDVSCVDGCFSEVYVDLKIGEIFDEYSNCVLLIIEQVLVWVQLYGLCEIYLLECDGVIWLLEVCNVCNQKVEVCLSGYDGCILYSECDGWLD